MLRFARWIVLLALVQGLAAQEVIRLKTGAVGGARTSRTSSAGHYILQFERFPGVEVRRELARRGPACWNTSPTTP